jgi:hypothetical protein
MHMHQFNINYIISRYVKIFKKKIKHSSFMKEIKYLTECLGICQNEILKIN